MRESANVTSLEVNPAPSQDSARTEVEGERMGRGVRRGGGKVWREAAGKDDLGGRKGEGSLSMHIFEHRETLSCPK